MFTQEQLFNWLGIVCPSTSSHYTYRSLETDSRLVDERTVFIALSGVSSNGWDYLDRVEAAGCSIALVPRGIHVKSSRMLIVEIDNLENALAQLVREIYGPAPKHIVAVTGTNGKSSTCYYIAQLADQMGYKSGMIGTFGIGPLGSLRDAKQTTPDLLTLHKLLSEFASQGIDFVAFEASSHALEQRRLVGVPLTTAVFTNLTRDHLDYHLTMENYAAAKAKLFNFPTLHRAVICLDSSYAVFFAEQSIAPYWFYSDHQSNAEFSVLSAEYQHDSVFLTLRVFEESYTLSLPLLGRFNIQNALAALASVWELSRDKAKLVNALSFLQGAPGRMQPIKVKGAPLVLVDYAHTSDALDVALSAVRQHVAGKLICVFGCGGDRDRGKRPLMLSVAQKISDEVWLTSDNPRTEDPVAIIDEILAAKTESSVLNVEVRREIAIQKAIECADVDDIVLIAGKGHETYQEVNGVRHHFDDSEEAFKALEAYVG
ncbi:UDP-N-acetylmuramoyl-L-alanyl-D-glutamate--2,6-diaminopimelate ligase [Marinomonas piezotolerans]|uniref:UDP-N-acetylmuramoyl-L-alanyl-D-glutamate--2,6-diaminopimelate ligase n=1 Tax=Marinomonas piezotolerans TaxID=2213058 RepID=A0A370U5A9_9GAMM|nr:UDP-N-acetylmuramoyl-L-alanyl-D-glutamate--2,6-diaminopimelate ligase [Marinomonas piezotolerans]RDL42969.1 UDP-N-acetylmuramoyl-L-alanyl-D-glutamate--2,6-diaminopimelate ligase [Marinomonas piezotolerans]